MLKRLLHAAGRLAAAALHGRSHVAFAAVPALSLIAAALLTSAPAAQAEGSLWTLPARPTWYWQLTGTIKNSEPAAVYDIDGFENSAEEVATLQAQGKHVICYIDVGTAENFRPDYHEFPPSVLGR